MRSSMTVDSDEKTEVVFLPAQQLSADVVAAAAAWLTSVRRVLAATHGYSAWGRVADRHFGAGAAAVTRALAASCEGAADGVGALVLYDAVGSDDTRARAANLLIHQLATLAPQTGSVARTSVLACAARQGHGGPAVQTVITLLSSLAALFDCVHAHRYSFFLLLAFVHFLCSFVVLTVLVFCQER